MPRDVEDGSAAAHKPRSSAPAAQPSNGAAAAADPHDAEWEQFQAFIADVAADKDTREGEDEAAEDVEDAAQDDGDAREAEQSLENMEYVDRYRQVLVQASATGANDSTGKRPLENEEEEEAEGLSSIVRAAAEESVKRRRLHTSTRPAGDAADESDGDDSDSLDLHDWRSKRI